MVPDTTQPEHPDQSQHSPKRGKKKAVNLPPCHASRQHPPPPLLGILEVVNLTNMTNSSLTIFSRHYPNNPENIGPGGVSPLRQVSPSLHTLELANMLHNSHSLLISHL